MSSRVGIRNVELLVFDVAGVVVVAGVEAFTITGNDPKTTTKTDKFPVAPLFKHSLNKASQALAKIDMFDPPTGPPQTCVFCFVSGEKKKKKKKKNKKNKKKER